MTLSFRFTYPLLIATVVLLPLYVVRFNLLGIPMTLLEVGILLTGAVWLVESRCWSRVGYFFHSITGRPWLFTFIGIWLLAASLSLVFADDTRAALGIYKAYVLEPFILMVVVADVVVAMPSRWVGVFKALMIAGLLVAITSISQWLSGWPNLAPAELAQGRMSSLFNSANAVGLFLGPIIILYLLCVVLGTDKSRLWLKCIPLGFYVAAFLLADSQGAWVALLVSLATVGLLYLAKLTSILPRLRSIDSRLLSMILIGTYAAACLGFVWFINSPPEVTNPWSRPEFTTLTVRQCVWQGTQRLLEHSPLLGAGLSGFPSEYGHYYTCDAEPLVYPHMLVLNFWVEFGLLGLLAALGVLAYWLKSALNLVETQFWMGAGFVGVIVYWLVQGLVDVPFFKNDLAAMWWLLVVLTITAGSYTANRQGLSKN